MAQEETIAALSLASFAAKPFAKNGVPDITLPHSCDKLSEIQTQIMLFEMAKSFTFEKLNHFDQISETLSLILKQGDLISYSQYSASITQTQLARSDLYRAFEDQYDILIAPSAIGEAPSTIDQTGNPIFSRGWTLTGLPCINLTVTTGPQGLPVGVTLVAGPRHDRLLLSVACALAQNLSDPLALNQA